MSPSGVKAAGAVLWRPSRKDGIRVAVVHRPRYDDWSLPKGKSRPGESLQVTAAREVWEETGSEVAIGRTLTTVSYSVSGRPKTVQYFAAKRLAGSFTPNKEVDGLDWLSLPAARQRMTYEFDKAVLDTFVLERADLAGVLLVRHGRAGHRESWTGEDATRPLDAKGRRQAQALVAELLPFGPVAVHSAPVERCVATVAPLAGALRVGVTTEPPLAEDAYRDDPAAARRRLVELAGGHLDHSVPGGQGVTGDANGLVVACSQGGVIPGVVKSLASRADITIPRTSTPKAAFWYLSFDGSQLVQADPYPGPAV